MQSFAEATLIYVAVTKLPNGSPLEVTKTRNVKVKEVKTFSVRYYQSYATLKRSMRHSRNFVVSKELVDDIAEDGKVYELMYLIYHGKKFTIREILRYYKKSTQMLLDCEETM